MKDYKKYLNPATKVPMIEVLDGDILVDKSRVFEELN